MQKARPDDEEDEEDEEREDGGVGAEVREGAGWLARAVRQ